MKKKKKQKPIEEKLSYKIGSELGKQSRKIFANRKATIAIVVVLILLLFIFVVKIENNIITILLIISLLILSAIIKKIGDKKK
jgi:hypothetical protein